MKVTRTCATPFGLIGRSVSPYDEETSLFHFIKTYKTATIQDLKLVAYTFILCSIDLLCIHYPDIFLNFPSLVSNLI